jgi:glutathione S-transferase
MTLPVYMIQLTVLQTADQTNYINYMKPIILAEELQIPYVLAIIDSKAESYYSIHPERYVPALKDADPETQQEFNVFESTACLQYLADRYDQEGKWGGRTASEKAAVLSWTAYQTAGLG